MVMFNFYGNIVNNVCVGLVGGLGFVVGVNYGYVYVVFEMVMRNIGKSIVNKNIVNFMVMLLVGCMMLDYFKLYFYVIFICKVVLVFMDNENVRFFLYFILLFYVVFFCSFL